MAEHPRIELSRLREIGWAQWDPIGLSQMGDDDWKEGGPCADEYDTYLLKAAGNLWNGEGVERVADYLVKVEVDWMGLSHVACVEERARRVAVAISDYVQSLRA